MSPSKERVSRPSVYLDIIRVMAALMVFSGHIRSLFLADGPDLASPGTGTTLGYIVVGYGYEAVMVFFVLSGYLIGDSVLRTLRRGDWSWERYMVARLSRLWAVLVPALVLGAIIDAWGTKLFGARYGQMIIMGQTTAKTFLGNLFFVQHIFVSEFGSNGPLWSLGFEFWYYVTFPCVAMAFFERRTFRRVAYAAAAVVLMLVLGRQIAIYFPLWLLGTAVAVVPKPSRQMGRMLVIEGLAGLSVVLVLTGTVPGVRGTYVADFAVALALAIFLVGLRMDSRTPSLAVARCARWLAGWSYSLYLTHFPVLVFWNAALFSNKSRWQPNPRNIAAVGAIGLLTLLYSYGISRLTEAHTDKIRRFALGRLAGLRRSGVSSRGA